MKQFFIVLKFELGNYFKSKSFLITTLILAVLVSGLVVIPPLFMKKDRFSSTETIQETDMEAMNIEEDLTEDQDALVLALADPKGVLSDEILLKESFGGYRWEDCQSLEEVKEKVENGSAAAGFVMEDELSYIYVVENLSMMDELQSEFETVYTTLYQERQMKEEGIDAEKVQEILSSSCTSQTEVLGKNSASNYWYTYILIFVLYFLVIFYGQMIATSVTSEKSNRAIEVLVTSVDSNSLIFGKVLAGAISGVFQVGAILGSGLLAYHFNADAWDHKLDFLFDIPMEVWGGFLLFGMLGYLLYAFIFGMLGALVSKTEDISKSASPITLIYVASFVVTMMGMMDSDSIVMKVASYIPFSSSDAMLARIALGSVSGWEIAVSAGILLVSVLLCGYLAAKIFRFGTLMYGNPVKFTHAIKKLKEQ
ncbi:MAG: ABC transporter permease [Fusicatenibacter sp.]|nr:ABC transporter permease [Lachnospiraceae bacterium]MDY2939016.1 ABC transporter permease [Fusicatenibacter sp.]